jgi:hypothetical protein
LGSLPLFLLGVADQAGFLDDPLVLQAQLHGVSAEEQDGAERRVTRRPVE